MPVSAGVGLRAEHYQATIDTLPKVGWLEVHGENYFAEGGAPLRYLEALRSEYPLSIHCVGMSLGSVDPLNDAHLFRLKELVQRFEPALVSDHLCWSSIDGQYYNDLLPLPYTEESLEHVAARVREVQDRLGCQLLVENLSSYLTYNHSTIAEWDFLTAVAEYSGCALLLDVNNVYVSAHNHGFDAHQFVTSVPSRHVAEIHVAGHAVNHVDGQDILIDDHASAVCDGVWALLEATIAHIGPKPCLVEWDTDLPDLPVLVAEALRADRVLRGDNALVA
ncbi:MAG: DUF692 domain-containing protein [Chromatiales bacterium]|nr:DUF692 domain-containing protein [Chromatiales bacterium]